MKMKDLYEKVEKIRLLKQQIQNFRIVYQKTGNQELKHRIEKHQLTLSALEEEEIFK